MISQLTKLRFIKITHTLVWTLFAGSILIIPILAWLEVWNLAAILIMFVLLECIILTLNHMRCPLTSLAARYADEERETYYI